MICPKCKKEVPKGGFCDLCGEKLVDSEKQTLASAPEQASSGKLHGFGGKYEVLKEIGRGGMGIVYEAVNKQIGKKVAIKKMKEELAINPREKKKFLDEAQSVAKLHHQNIVDIYDIIEEEKQIYIVFECVEGKTVEELINSSGKIQMERAVKITRQVCEALEYAHGHGTVHRDIKPSNIIVGDDGWAKLMDFGIARTVKDTVSKVTGKDTSGSPPYMAPEQELGKFSRESDIYSVGVCLYEMLTGELPFKPPNYLAQKERMVYKRVREIIPDITEEISAVIDRCLQAEKEKRYNKVQELKEELEKI